MRTVLRSLGTAVLAAAVLGPVLPCRGATRGGRCRPSGSSTSVNPFIGTQDYGNTFPGASAAVRHGPAQPGHRRPGRLRPRQDSIDGFSQTHLSGVGCGGRRRAAASCRRPARSTTVDPSRYALALPPRQREGASPATTASA